MADGSVLLEVVIEGKNVKVVQRQVEGVTNAVNENTNAQGRNTRAARQNADAARAAGDSHNHFDRGLKGSGGSSSNATKNFSKMRDSMSGSSGLVGAYATLAANLFAATAAFAALQRAAQVEQLTSGLQSLGRSSGLAMIALSKGLQEATGYSVSQWNQRQSGERNKKSQEDYWDKYNEAVVASERKKAEKEAAEAKAEADKAKAEAAASEVEKGVLLDIININYH
jgi:hypothetical protein